MNLAYFDLTNMQIDRKMVKILGFKRIFTTEEICITEGLNTEKACIVMSGEPGILGRALHRNNVKGIIIKDNELLKMVVEEVKNAGKLLCFSTHDLTCVDTRMRLRNIHRMRNLIAFATRSKAKIALLTLADDESCLLSSLQMVEVAKFLGATEEHAKSMVSNIGDVL